MQIFNVRHRLKRLEGNDIDFYKYVGVSNGLTATTEDIARAYRKRSLLLQYTLLFPAPSLTMPALTNGKQGFQKKKHRSDSLYLGTKYGFHISNSISLVNQVLRDPIRRQRYDFFHKNGFPEWFPPPPTTTSIVAR